MQRCKVCAKKVNENQYPCQADLKRLRIYDFPEYLRCIQLQRVLTLIWVGSLGVRFEVGGRG